MSWRQHGLALPDRLRLGLCLGLWLRLTKISIYAGLVLASTLTGTAVSAAEPAIVDPTAADTTTTDTNRAIALLKDLQFPAGAQIAYEEIQMNPMLKEPVSQQGFVEITDEGAFVMQVTTPRPEQRRLEQGKLSLKRPSKKALRRNPDSAVANARSRTLTLNPEHGGHLVLLAITQVLSGNISALQHNFQLHSSPSSPCEPAQPCEPWSVVLTPKNEKVKKRLLKLELNGVRDSLHSLYTQRSSKAWQRITFITGQP